MRKHPAYYSLTDDFDLVVASLHQQYGVRLSTDLKGMKTSELFMLIKGIGPDTPLGRIVSIRAEKDEEVIRNFGPEEKRIRSEWQKKQAKKVTPKQQTDVLEALKQAFISMAGGEANE